jgi:hypothetical protein
MACNKLVVEVHFGGSLTGVLGVSIRVVKLNCTKIVLNLINYISLKLKIYVKNMDIS